MKGHIYKRGPMGATHRPFALFELPQTVLVELAV